MPGIFAEPGGDGDARLNGVGGDAVGHQFEGELPDVGFQHGFRRRDGAVAGNHAMPASAGHSIDAASLPQHLPPHQFLNPVDEVISHHIHGHFHLRLGRLPLRDSRKHTA